MKMGTTASPWRYEAALKFALRPANALIPSCRRGDYVDLACSGSKDEACPRVGAQELIWHLGLGDLVERFAGAVQWNDVVDIDVLERRDRVAHIVFLIGGEVESADHRMNLVDPGSRLGLPDRVDHAAMAARGQNDQPASFQVERGGDLVPELVGNDRLGPVALRKPVGIAPHPVVHADLHGAGRQELLK